MTRPSSSIAPWYSIDALVSIIGPFGLDRGQHGLPDGHIAL